MAIINFLPLYDQYFSPLGARGDLAALNSTHGEIAGPLSARPADFSMNTPTEWQDTAKNTATFILKIVIFPWGLYELAKHVVQRLVMIPLYPAQSRIVKFIATKLFGFPVFSTELDECRQETCRELQNRGYIVRHVSLEKDGMRYSGLLIGHRNTINNGNWVLQATGNLELIEHSAMDFAASYKNADYNTLLVNGPAVGRSQGHATPDSMGDAQIAGLSFLETAIRAQKIVVAGRSLGGAAIGLAALRHNFRDDIRYLFVRQVTFDSVSNIASRLFGPLFEENFVRRLVLWCDCEMDSVASSRRLQQLNIREVLVQTAHRDVIVGDGIIPAEASLGQALRNQGLIENKVFIHIERYEGHMSDNGFLAAMGEIRAL